MRGVGQRLRAHLPWASLSLAPPQLQSTALSKAKVRMLDEEERTVESEF